MRTSRIITLAAAAVCLLGLSACTKNLSGLQIRFRASTSPKAPSTKTAYSGANFSSGGTVSTGRGRQQQDGPGALRRRERPHLGRRHP